MASAPCFVHVIPSTVTLKPRRHVTNSSGQRVSTTTKLQSVKAKAAAGNGNTKPKSVICADCDGNGAVLCSQCKGSGVNSVDLFNGQFKAGDSCWLCGGKKDILCGNCNGAGFIGGFMSTFDERSARVLECIYLTVMNFKCEGGPARRIVIVYVQTLVVMCWDVQRSKAHVCSYPL